MSEIEDTAHMEFVELHVHVQLGELDSEFDIAGSCTDGRGRVEELLGVVLSATLSTSGMAHCDGRTVWPV